MYDSAHIEFFEIGVLLADTHIEDGLGSGVDEGKCSADLIVDSIELGEKDGVDFRLEGLSRLFQQGLVELGDLVDCVIAHQRLPNEHH